MKPINAFTEKYNLEKIPDSVLLSQSLIENGKLQVYIQELEEKVKNIDLREFQIHSKKVNELIQQEKGLLKNIEKSIILKQSIQNEIVEARAKLQEVKKESHFYKTYEM